MANRKRRGDDAVEERLDEDALAADEELDEELLDDEEYEDEDDSDERSPARGNGRSGTATRPRTAGAAKKAGPPGRKSVKIKESDRPGIIGRLVNFVREVVAELRKVIWPTRKELLTYTAVVLVFVAIVVTIVGLLDYGFAKAVLFVFGTGK